VTSETTTEAGDERFGLRAAEGGGATPDEAEPGGVAVADFPFVEAEGPEHVDPAQMAPVAEAGGQHADDLVGLAVDADRATDDVGVTPEPILPVAVTDDEDSVVAEDLLVGTEAAAELRSGAERGKEIGGDAEAVGHLGRFVGLGQAHVRTRVGGNLAVAAHLGLQIEVVGRRETAAGVFATGAIDAVQSIAVGR